MRGTPVLLCILLLPACASGPGSGLMPSPPSLTPAGLPGLAFLREAEIRADLDALASDAMRGREAGTIDELRASAWVAERARAAGLEPAGEDGTWYQFFALQRQQQSVTSRIAVNGEALQLWRDVAVIGLANIDLDAPVAWLPSSDETALASADVTGRVAALLLDSRDAPPPGDALAARRFINAAVQRIGRTLRERGAAAVVVVTDAVTERLFELAATTSMRGRYALDTGEPQAVPAMAPTLLVRHAWRDRLASPGARFTARLTVDSFLYPSVNVIGRVRGTDPVLRDEYVLISAHQDHDGVRASIDGDSIWNGADDNATVAVAALAIARAFVAQPGRRSALFVWHGAEEKGLFGSRWHADRPVVPRESIVAVLNADMIGRNHPDSAALLGVIPPHRNSTALAQMALDANARFASFALDSTWDRPDHREGWYFRSDHLPYARLNVPALFFSSLLHADYHTPRDGPERIDVAKLTRIAKWMYATGWAVANADERPRIDPGFRLERD